jgi:hypothetical protein
MAKRLQKPFDFHPEAMIEAREAVEWYSERSPLAAKHFKSELQEAERQIRQDPQRWAIYLHGTRYFKLRRFPFTLVYAERGDRIIGVAVAHMKRRPGYWRTRLPE